MKKFVAMSLICCLLTSVSLWARGTGSSETYAGTEGKITVYMSGPAPMVQKLEQKFEETHGDVLDLVHMGCGPLRQRVWAEMESGSIRADVFWGSDPLLYEALAQQGALYSYRPKGYEHLLEPFRVEAPYTLVNERYGVIMYNTEAVTTPPSSYADLTGEAFRGATVHADPAQSSTALALVAALWDLMDGNGDFYRKMAANDMFLAQKNGHVASRIQEGEFDAGIAPHDAVWRKSKAARRDGFPLYLAVSWPLEGAVAIQRPIAISRNEQRPEVNQHIAEEFVDFMISVPAQTITTQFGFVSVRDDVPLPAGVPENRNARTPNWKKLAESQNQINETFRSFFE